MVHLRSATIEEGNVSYQSSVVELRNFAYGSIVIDSLLLLLEKELAERYRSIITLVAACRGIRRLVRTKIVHLFLQTASGSSRFQLLDCRTYPILYIDLWGIARPSYGSDEKLENLIRSLVKVETFHLWMDSGTFDFRNASCPSREASRSSIFQLSYLQYR